MKSRRRVALIWFLRILVLGAVAAVWFLPPFSSEQTDTARIARYAADFDLSADGTLRSTETLDVEMPPGKHGIYRIFDTTDERRHGVDHPVSDVTVTRDGRPEPSSWVDSARGTRSLRIGDAGTILDPGVHTYVITSTTTDALERGPDGTVRWWWNVVGSGWQMEMDSASITATLPAEVTKAECVMATDTPCTANLSERKLTVQTGHLAPHTPVTVRATFPKGALPEPPADPRNPDLVYSIGLAIIGAALGAWFIKTTRERAPGFPVLFEPPEGISPALGARVLDEVDSDDALQATLYDLGAAGVVRLDGNDDAWSVNLLVDPAAAQIGDMERAVLTGLGLTFAGDSFLVTSSATSGEKIATARATLKQMVHVQGATYLTPSAAGIVGNLLGWLAVAGVVALAFMRLMSGDGIWFGWPAFFGLAAFAFVVATVSGDPTTRTKRTREGRDLWSRTGGFARFLTTDSSESRFDAAAHMDWYPRYLAWALVFGSADAWARRYEAQGVAVPEVPWIYWTGTGHMGTSFASSVSQSFDAAISSASASYAASQASSGSGSFGGGGFGGDSGGGGGGGGSW